MAIIVPPPSIPVLPWGGPYNRASSWSTFPQQPIEISVTNGSILFAPISRVRTHCPSQKMTVAARVMALKKVWAQRS
jgi:hypothetical protein